MTHAVGAVDDSAADSLVLPTPLSVCPSSGQLVGPSPCSVAQTAPSGLLDTNSLMHSLYFIFALLQLTRAWET